MSGLLFGPRLALGSPLTLGKGGGDPRLRAPDFAVPQSGTIYVSGASPSALPAGNDTTGNGSLASPYATLTKALSMVPSSGDYLIRCDGTFAENTSAGGRWILAGNFSAPVLIDSYSGDANNFIITNASGTNGVVNIRATLAAKIQIRRATIRSSTDNNPLFFNNPTGADVKASAIAFFDCVFEARTQNSVTSGAIALRTNIGISGFYLVRCQFKRVVGTNTNFNPIIADTGSQTATVDNQPLSDVGFWDCETTDANWFSFCPSAGFSGIAKFTFVRNTFRTGVNYGVLVGRDTSGDTTPKCTDVLIHGNTIEAGGTNPHAIVIGSNVQAAVVSNNILSTGLQGIVCKGSADALVQGNNVTIVATVATGTALYAKAAAGTKFRGNVVNIDGSAFACIGFREDVDGSNKASDTELTSNNIAASGANAQALNWATSAGSDGGAISNDNVISLASGASLGTVRGTTVANQAELRAVWATAGLAGDDAANDSRTIAA